MLMLLILKILANYKQFIIDGDRQCAKAQQQLATVFSGQTRIKHTNTSLQSKLTTTLPKIQFKVVTSVKNRAL